MCGIAGLYRRHGRVDLGRMHHLSRLLRHRGPDDEGLVLIDPRGGQALTMGGPDTPETVYESRFPWAPGRRFGDAAGAEYGVGLVNRRLAIVDLSPAGHQPMCDAEGKRWIAYNGEIYNHVELRAELERMGETFVGGSDTEVILAAYRRWGLDALHRLNGMFAFAIWDTTTRELIGVRDRLGVKPFYYQWDGDSLAFASEPKALVLTQPRPITANPFAVRDLLALDWVDHEVSTFFEGLSQLPAGHVLVASERGVAIRRWWSLDPERRATGTPEDWERRLEELFTDAVRIRLRADVEVGACLSGGIDSSAVVVTASRLMGRPMHAFTCAYDEGPGYDERAWVRATVEASGAISHVVVPDGADFWPVFDRLAFQQDEPTAGGGVYSQWKVMELAHAAGLRVLLDGQGGDETLAGYFRYLPIRLRDLLVRGRLLTFLAMFGPVASRLGAAHTLALTLEPWLPRGLVAPLRRAFGQGKDRVLSDALGSATRGGRAAPPKPPADFPSHLARQLAFDTTRRLLPSLLRYEDRNSMGFSIETRLPFLDYRLLEFVFSLPDEQKLDGGTTKAIFRRVMRDRVPGSVLARTDKMGFETPVDAWLRGRGAAEVRRRLLEPGPLHDWVDPFALEKELDAYLTGRRSIGLQVWRWLSLESWSRRMLAGDPRVVERPPEFQTHPGLHKSYRQVEGALEPRTGVAAG